MTILIYFLIFASFLDTHAQMPILSPWAASLGATPFLIGLIIGSYSLFNILGNLWAGIVIDSRGFHKPLALSLAGITLVVFSYAFLSSPLEILLLRSVHGLLGGFLIPSTLGALNTLGSSSKRFSFYGICIGLAALTGPLLTGFLAGFFSFQLAYLGLALALLPAALISISLKFPEPPKEQTGHIAPLEKIKLLIARPVLRSSFFFAFALMGATGTMMLFLPLRLEVLGISSATTGLYFALFALSTIITLALWPLIFPRVREEKILIISGLFISLFSISFLPFVSQVILGICILGYGVGFGLVFPSLIRLINSAPDPHFGSATGVFFAFYSAGVVGVPPLAAFIWDLTGIFPTITAVILGIVSTITGFLSIKKRPISNL